MEFIGTRGAPPVYGGVAILKGIAPDGGLYVPSSFPRLKREDLENMLWMDYPERAACIMKYYLDDYTEAELKEYADKAYARFENGEPAPVTDIDGETFIMELFHGPTLAFKDVGGRFMARMLSYFIAQEGGGQKVTVIVATSGDTGSAVANGFLGVEGIDVIVLYPKGKVSEIQEKQFTTLGRNITALEVAGNFDDCQRLVKSAFMDPDLNRKLTLTSANSINVARFLPQAFYYFNAYAQLKRQGKAENIVFCVPSGNFGNITAGLIAWRMGLPVRRFIAANNRNDVFLEYLKTGIYSPRASVQTLANAMDVGDPSNFARVAELYGNSVEAVRKDISGCRYTDEDIRNTIATVYGKYGYLLDPHGACGYQGLADNIAEEETGVFLETAHPAKFKETVEGIIRKDIEIPQRLRDFMAGEKMSVGMSSDFNDFKEYLMTR